MSISRKQFDNMLQMAATTLIQSKEELTQIDAKFGDADHGITMEKVANAILKGIADTPEDASVQTLLKNISGIASRLSGGSAGSLWGVLLMGLAQNAPDVDTLQADDLQTIFVSGLSNLQAITPAIIGEKTMMDALIPAVQTMEQQHPSIVEMFAKAAEAANDGATATEHFVSKYGRAKSYGTQTIGTPDAGAVSMKYFFEGLHAGLVK